jgi:hypothetical protein
MIVEFNGLSAEHERIALNYGDQFRFEPRIEAQIECAPNAEPDKLVSLTM